MAVRLSAALLLALEIRGLYISISDRKWKVLYYYTQLSNIVAAVSALLLLVCGQMPFVTVIRYLATCMLVMTFFVTLCILIPMGADPHAMLWSGNCLYHHVLCPVVSTVSYVFLENHAGSSWIFLPVAVTLIYGFIMLYLNYIRKADGPYPFFRVHDQSLAATVLWVIALFAIITVFSAGVSFVAK